MTITIGATDAQSYEFVCIADHGCEPEWADDTHTPRCHRENDRERREFYADLADEAAVRFLTQDQVTPIYRQVATTVKFLFFHV